MEKQKKPGKGPYKLASLLMLSGSFACGGPGSESQPQFETAVSGMGVALPFSDNFEGTSLGMEWTARSTNTGRIQLLSTYNPHEGNQHLVMDDRVSNSSKSLNEITLNVDVSTSTGVQLRFWARESNDENNALPQTFTGSYNGEGVAISDDNNSWYRIVDFTTLTNSYQRFTIDVDAAIAAAGMTAGSDFYIRFSQYDDYGMTSDGILIDQLIVATNLPDDISPTGSLSIDAGATTTATSAVVLTVTATDTGGSGLGDISFSNDGMAWSMWENWSPTMGNTVTKSWNLTDQNYGGNIGIGTKFVYYRVRDVANNQSANIVSSISYQPTGQNAVIPFSDDFETGILGPWWNTNSTANGRLQVSSANAPRGSYHVLMDSSSGSALNELILTLDLNGQSNVYVSFSAKDFNDETHNLPAVFTGSANGDGVAISEDGMTWYTVQNIGTLINASYQTLAFALDALAQSNGLSYGPNFKIKFTQYDNSSISVDGIAYDNIQVLTPANDTTPPTGTIMINGGASSGYLLATGLSLSASDSSGLPIDAMRLSNDGMTWAPWTPYATSVMLWDMGDARYGGDLNPGVKTVHVQYRDIAGNISISYSDDTSFILHPNVCAAATATNLALPTTSQSGTLGDISNHSQYIFDGYGNRYLDGYLLNLQGRSGTVAVTLSSTAFDTVLYVYEDSGSNCTLVGRNLDAAMTTNSELTFQVISAGSYRVIATTTSTLATGAYAISTSGQLIDNTAPTGSISINGGSATTLGTNVTINVSATDTGGSGLSDMRFSNDGMAWDAWRNYATSAANWDLTDSMVGGTSATGAKTVYVQFRDGQGNVSISYSDSINYSTGSPASFPYSTDFPSTTLGSEWLTQSTGNGRIRVTSSYGPNSSPYHVVMDTSSNYALNEMILVLDMTGATSAHLKFAAREWSDEQTALPTSYTGSRNGDGVSISDDGFNWYRVETLATLTSSYRDFDIDLDAAILAASMNYSSLFYVKFQQYDNVSLTSDGIGFDDIEVVSVVPDNTSPTGSISIENGTSTTTNLVVTLTLSATDNMGGSGLADMRFSNDSNSWTSWESYATSRSGWDLSDSSFGGTSAAGTKTVYVQYRDIAGNASNSYSDTITYTASDTTAPTGSVSINGGASTTSNPIVSLSLSATDNMGGSGVNDMQFSSNGIIWSPWESYATTKNGWDLTDTTYGGNSNSGTKIVYARFRDVAGNVSTNFTDTITYSVMDNTAPTGAISIANGAPSTTGLLVTLNLFAQDNMGGSGVGQMRFSNDGMNWSAWQSYASTKLNWDLAAVATGGSSGSGTKRAYVKYRDNAGNESISYSDTIIYSPPDMIAPTGSILIEAGNASTSAILVVLTLNASDNIGVIDMALSNNGTTWAAWENYVAQRSGWDLSAAATGGNSSQGVKTVHVRFRDAAGNVSSNYSDSINYDPPDTTAPTGTIQINSGASATADVLVNINCNAQDEMGGSGIHEMRFSNDNRFWSAWESYASLSMNWDLSDVRFGGDNSEGSKTVYAIFRDRAGNESFAANASINLVTMDSTAPSMPTDVMATAVSSSQIVLSWSPSSDDIGVKHYHVQSSLDGMNFSVTATVTAAVYSDSGLNAETPYFYRISAFDEAGNESPASEIASAMTLVDMPGIDAGFVDVGANPGFDAGTRAGVDGGTNSSTTGNSNGGKTTRRNTRRSDDPGCSCKASGTSASSTGLLLLLLGGALISRRRRA